MSAKNNAVSAASPAVMTEVKNLTRKRLTVRKIDLANQAKGYTFRGRYQGESESEPFTVKNEETGELVTKTLKFGVFENLEDKEDRFKIIMDAGLRTALHDAMVEKGHAIEVVKLDKIKLKGAKTMNQYDVFSLS